MSFQAVIARDMAFIHGRDDGEFNVAVLFWASNLDPAVDDATTETRGTYFLKPGDRVEDERSQHMPTTVTVTVPTEGVAEIDSQGWMSVAGVVYSIEFAHAQNGSWTVKGSRDDEYAYGDVASALGG